MKKLGATTLAPLVMLLPAVAFAHSGDHGLSSWSAGVLHPWLGLDHLLTLIAAGFWLTQQQLHNRIALGATFIGLLGIGIIVGSLYPNVQLEPGITATLIVLGVLVACAVKVRLLIGIVVLGIVALIHGFVHGTELSTNTSNANGFATGLSMSSGVVLLLSRALVDRMRCHTVSIRLAGTAIAIVGAFLAF